MNEAIDMLTIKVEALSKTVSTLCKENCRLNNEIEGLKVLIEGKHNANRISHKAMTVSLQGGRYGK